jgi:hypothetical protein
LHPYKILTIITSFYSIPSVIIKFFYHFYSINFSSSASLFPASFFLFSSLCKRDPCRKPTSNAQVTLSESMLNKKWTRNVTFFDAIFIKIKVLCNVKLCREVNSYWTIEEKQRFLHHSQLIFISRPGKTFFMKRTLQYQILNQHNFSLGKNFHLKYFFFLNTLKQ